ncbi:MAG: class I SAM-dependent methyltransferase [Acidimicrobiales bacterium]
MTDLRPPWPGDELVSRVTGLTDRDIFFDSGQQSVQDLDRALAVIGRSLESYSTILEFGCGCGRIMLWLEHLAAGADLHGVDIDERAIRWAQANMPYATFAVNEPLPPLDYPDGFFDLVYNHSVFTHLDEEHQDRWLEELRRVTAPGGHLVLSVHGEKALADFEEGSRGAGGDPSGIRDEVLHRGISFISHDSFTGGPFPDAYHSTFHAPWYVLEHWSQYFDVRAYVPRGSLGFQDFVLLERPAGDGPTTAARRSGARGPRFFTETAAAPPPPARGAVRRAIELPLHGPAPEGPARWGELSRGVRRAVLRVLSHSTNYQRGVDRQFQEALAEMDAVVSEVAGTLEQLRAAGTVDGVLTLQESNVRLWDSLRRHGERVNRLEEDLWAALEQRAGAGAGGAAPPTPPSPPGQQG